MIFTPSFIRINHLFLNMLWRSTKIPKYYFPFQGKNDKDSSNDIGLRSVKANKSMRGNDNWKQRWTQYEKIWIT
jgi:hypothetical protein